MATLIPIDRLRRQARSREGMAREEAFWRNSMLPSAIAMGAIIVLASGTLALGVETRILSGETMVWVLIAALVSVFALTKIIIANLLFYALANEKPRVPVRRGPQPTNRAPRPDRQSSASSGRPGPVRSREREVALAANE